MIKKNLNVLITGATSGIGHALAIHYAKNGARNVFICGRDKQRLYETKIECEKSGAKVWAEIVDVTNRSQTREWIENCEKLADINLVIANAGVATVTETEDAVYNTFKTNIYGVVNTVMPTIDIYKKRTEKFFAKGNSSLDQFIQKMKHSRKAFFVNPFSKRHLGNIGCELFKSDNKTIAIVSSIAGYHGLPSCPSYSASKACVKAWGEGLRGSLKQYGINVSVICPGFVKSRITDQNTCPMPFFMNAEKAAAIIASRIEKNVGLISFPWQLRFTSWLVSILPNRISEIIYNRLPEKTAKKP